MRTIWAILFISVLSMRPDCAEAAIGCSLNNPDEDIQRFFPEMTSYRVHFVSFKIQNPEGHQLLEEKLKAPLDPVFETIDVPYSLYIVEGESSRLGYVLGSNNRGAHSSIQVIAALNPQGQLLEVYLQRIRSPEADRFRSAKFLETLSQHSLQEFARESSCFSGEKCEGALVADPSEGRALQDYQAILRGLAKLHWLQELLLLPLGGPAPPSIEAQAEWIGSHVGPGYSTADALALTPRLAAPQDFEPDEQVLVWGLGEHALVWPLAVLESHASAHIQVGQHTLLLARANRSGNPVMLKLSDPQQIRPTRDVLWNDQIFVDWDTRSRWSLSLGQAVYGSPGKTPPLRLKSGAILTWSEAQQTGLQLVTLSTQDLPDATPQSFEHLVVETNQGRVVWPLDELPRHTLSFHSDILLARIGSDALAWSIHDQSGRSHEFSRADSFHVVDRGTESRWSLISGRALTGPLQGAQLTPLPTNRLNTTSLEGLFPLATPGSQNSTMPSP